MDTIVNKYYVVDNEIFESNSVNYQFDNSSYLLYEVLRTANGIFIFLEDHLERMKKAIVKFDLTNSYKEEEVIENIKKLLLANKHQRGNIKLLCRHSNSNLQYASYYIPHSYPDEKAYEEGVILSTFSIERTNPGIKQIKTNNFIKKKLENSSLTKNSYDVLLINKQGLVTEGSRSNFFLISGGKIFSASESLILPGITRKYVIKAASMLNIEIVERDIKYEEMGNYEAAFLSGTSPKVLPVKKIDDFQFLANHPLLTRIKNKFNAIFDEYIQSRMG